MIKLDYYLSRDFFYSITKMGVNFKAIDHYRLDFLKFMNTMLQSNKSELNAYLKKRGQYINHYMFSCIPLEPEVPLIFKAAGGRSTEVYMDKDLAEVFKEANELCKKYESLSYGMTWKCFLTVLFRKKIWFVTKWLDENKVNQEELLDYFCEESLSIDKYDTPYECRDFLKEIKVEDIDKEVENKADEISAVQLQDAKYIMITNKNKGKDSLEGVKLAVQKLKGIISPIYNVFYLNVEEMFFKDKKKIQFNIESVTAYLKEIGETIIIISIPIFETSMKNEEAVVKFGNFKDLLITLPNIRVLEEFTDEEFEIKHLIKMQQVFSQVDFMEEDNQKENLDVDDLLKEIVEFKEEK